MNKCDFSGWATRNDMLCSDGLTIRKNAFKNSDGKKVPLVWNHQHNDLNQILGHAILENRDDGVYAYCYLNNTESGRAAKDLVSHGDVRSLSIFANKLQKTGTPPQQDVVHGLIREVSIVLAGANPGAFIESIIAHGDGEEDGFVLGYDENITLYHTDDEKEEEKKEMDSKLEHDDKEKTIGDIFETLNEEQKMVVYAMIGQALSDEDDIDKDLEGGKEGMKHNIFDNDDVREDVLTHADTVAIFADAKRYGSLKDSVLAHGIDDIEFLFPDAKNITNTPIFIQRDTGWVRKVMNSVRNTPFSRIKSILADITEDDARAKGYIKGKMKKEEVFTLLKRSTSPTTIYKKQKLDRDDVVDITDFDVVAWLKAEMRAMLDEEIARAILVGDGRLSSSDEKINEQNIRPIWTDADLYTIKASFVTGAETTSEEKAKEFIRTVIKSRKNYKGSGEPTLYTTEDILTDCLLIEDGLQRVIYDSVEKLATALRVKEIVTVPVMEDLERTHEVDTFGLMGIIVNLTDYNIGADKGGAINMFDDFDIDYNAQKYLIETRCSGALIRPYSAIAIEAAIHGAPA